VLQKDVGGAAGKEDRAVARIRPAVTHRDDRNLVDGRLLRQRKRDAGRERDRVGRASGPFAFQALIAFHSAVGGVAGVAFLEHDLDAVDTAIALVDELVVVGDAVGDWDTIGRRRRRCGRRGWG
jgi:hypothetical protein